MQITPKAILGKFEEEVEKGVKSQAKQVAQSVQSQFGVQSSSSAPPQNTSDAGTQEAGGHGQNPQQSGGQQDQFTKEFVQEMYAPSNPHHAQQAHGYGSGQQQPSQFLQNQLQQGKSPEDALALEALRKKLHDETYYIPLTKSRSGQEEERPAEKVEREKMEELQHDEDKKKNAPPPLAVQMGANRAEQFPGVSG